MATFDQMFDALAADWTARVEESEPLPSEMTIANWRAVQAANRVKFADLISKCLDGDLEATDCPRCDERAFVHDAINKRDICLECLHERPHNSQSRVALKAA